MKLQSAFDSQMIVPSDSIKCPPQLVSNVPSDKTHQNVPSTRNPHHHTNIYASSTHGVTEHGARFKTLRFSLTRFDGLNYRWWPVGWLEKQGGCEGKGL
ncbi:hypothetical protein Tco_0004263 [Tanacetum coccineum]